MASASPVDRSQPTPLWPRAGASFALFQGPAILLVERAKPPRAGLWSLPGGHIEPGEPAHVAASRELHEETGIRALPHGLVDIADVILRGPAGELHAHYLLAVFYGSIAADGTVPRAASDARDARFVDLDRLGEFPLTPDAKRLIALAWASVGTVAR